MKGPGTHTYQVVKEAGSCCVGCASRGGGRLSPAAAHEAQRPETTGTMTSAEHLLCCQVPIAAIAIPHCQPCDCLFPEIWRHGPSCTPELSRQPLTRPLHSMVPSSGSQQRFHWWTDTTKIVPEDVQMQIAAGAKEAGQWWQRKGTAAADLVDGKQSCGAPSQYC